MNKEISPIDGTFTYVVEYIWFGGNNEFRSKVRCIHSHKNFLTIEDIGLWNYDGSSTNQATTEDSEVILKPVQLYKDSSDKNKYFVLCETFKYSDNDLKPLINNFRYKFTELENKFGKTIRDNDFWFGFEQEFFIWDLYQDKSIGFNKKLPEQGPYYCKIESVSNNDLENYHNINETRKYTEIIFQRCLDLNLGVTGWNLEVAPGQTEIQIFGHYVKACDDLIMLRYICHTELSKYNLKPNFHPKPLGNDWNGSGLHTNISTNETRKENGFEIIKKYMEKFDKTHKDHINDYGEENNLRLTGIHETSSLEKFSYGVASRASSVRIPRETFINNKGYFEDRRPCAWANPYKIASRIIETIVEENK